MFGLRINIRFIINFVLGALVIYCLVFWLVDFLSGEAGRIKKFINRGKRAVEACDILASANVISRSYQDKYGNQKQTLVYVIKNVYSRYSPIFIDIQNMDIKINQDNLGAAVEIKALVIGENRQNAKEKILEGEKGRFRLSLVKEEGKWLVVEIEFLESLPLVEQAIG